MKLTVSIKNDAGKTIMESVVLETDVVDKFGHVFTQEALIEAIRRIEKSGQLLVIDRTDP
jgi:hypothetical protein